VADGHGDLQCRRHRLQLRLLGDHLEPLAHHLDLDDARQAHCGDGEPGERQGDRELVCALYDRGQPDHFLHRDVDAHRKVLHPFDTLGTPRLHGHGAHERQALHVQRHRPQRPGDIAALDTFGPGYPHGPGHPPATSGYDLVASDGGIFAFGTSTFYGSMGDKPLDAPVVGIAAAPTGKGYWAVASDGGIFAFGTAGFYGSMGGQHLDAPVVGMTATPTGKGYWEVASDGGIFAFGTATFYGSMGGKPLDAPVVGITAAPTGNGYWEVASDGGIFAFGTATFYGSMGGKPLDKPVVGIAES